MGGRKGADQLQRGSGSEGGRSWSSCSVGLDQREERALAGAAWVWIRERGGEGVQKQQQRGSLAWNRAGMREGAEQRQRRSASESQGASGWQRG
eukprot:2611961-Rhodomonas_salina.1